jgi:hypothetical protein
VCNDLCPKRTAQPANQQRIQQPHFVHERSACIDPGACAARSLLRYREDLRSLQRTCQDDASAAQRLFWRTAGAPSWSHPRSTYVLIRLRYRSIVSLSCDWMIFSTCIPYRQWSHPLQRPVVDCSPRSWKGLQITPTIDHQHPSLGFGTGIFPTIGDTITIVISRSPATKERHDRPH